MLVSNEDEKGAPAQVVLDMFFSNDRSVLVSNEDEKDTFFSYNYSVLVSNEDEKGVPAQVVLETHFQ